MEQRSVKQEKQAYDSKSLVTDFKHNSPEGFSLLVKV